MSSSVSIRVQPWLLLALLLASGMSGCAAAPQARTTFLNSVDLMDMTDRMAASFANNEMIGARTPEDEPWVISMYRVSNQTNQIIPDRERWIYVGRLRALLAQSDLSRQRSIIWVIPPEQWPIVAEELNVAHEPYGLRMDPTHLLTGRFSTLTLTHARGRSDAYLCSYQLVDLQTGAVVWEDSWEVKRAIAGLTFD